MKSASKRVWIDLDNSPHVPFFAPIIEELESRGYSVVVTARDAYQVKELADFFKLKCTMVGRHYGKHRVAKILGTAFRGQQLASIMRKHKPDLAVAHGSRSQTVACMLLGIPSLAMTDYEFVNTAAMFKATWMMVPEVVAAAAENFVSKPNVLSYPGIKEDVYAPGFKPNSAILAELGLDESQVIVTARPPATEAHYHVPESDVLFDASMERMAQTPSVKIVLLPRNARQTKTMRDKYHDLFASGKAMIPERAVDGLNLIWHSDLVISGGGTMNREACALGVPVYSVFRGKIGAVDQYLAKNGRMVLLESVEDVQTKLHLSHRARSTGADMNSLSLQSIVNQIAAIVDGQNPKAAHSDSRGKMASSAAAGAVQTSAAARMFAVAPDLAKPSEGRVR